MCMYIIIFAACLLSNLNETLMRQVLITDSQIMNTIMPIGNSY